MRTPNEAERFIRECYPKGLPLYKRTELRKELLSHILDKADFFMETGKGEEESIHEAVKEMGDPSKIRQSFGNIYRYERLPGIVVFVLLSLVCAFAFFSGFMFFGSSWTGDYPTVFHFFISTAFTGSIVFLYIYGFRRKNAYLLLSVTVFLLLNLLTSLLTSAIFQSFAIGLIIMICAFLRIPESTSSDLSLLGEGMLARDVVDDWCIPVTFGIMILLFLLGAFLTVAVFTASKRKRPPKKIKHQKPLILYFSLIFSLTVLSSLLFYVTTQEYSFAKSNNSFIQVMEDIIADKKARKLYEELTAEMSLRDAEILLRENGFVECRKTYFEDYLSEWKAVYSMENSKVFRSESSKNSFLYPYDASSVILCFEENKLTFKQVDLYQRRPLLFGYRKYENTARFYETFLQLKKGDSQETVINSFSESFARLESAYRDYNSGIEYIEYNSEAENKKDLIGSVHLRLKLVFENGELQNAEISGFGFDEKYNYNEIDLDALCF